MHGTLLKAVLVLFFNFYEVCQNGINIESLDVVVIAGNIVNFV